jgi:hypothetical protein
MRSLKRFSAITIVLLLVIQGVSSFSQKPAKVITPELLCSHIYYLASDSLMGRNTPSPGLDSAAAYIAREFSSYGVQPVNGSYFQTFFLCRKNLGDSNKLTITKEGIIHELMLKSGFVPFEVSGSGRVASEVVFAGYGISAPELNYDDYSGIDVRGKIVLVLRSEPQKDDSTSVFDGAKSSKYASLKEKMDNAIRHGAVTVMVVNGPLNYKSMKPRGFPWPALSKVIPADALPTNMCADSESSVPVIHVGEEAVSLLFGSVDSLRNLQARIDSTLTPVSFEFPAINASADINMKEERMATQNVAIGAHYDHVGYMKEHADSITDFIFNGADDNGSGTAGVMAVAKAFAQLKKPPLRTVLFILFAGEEQGLFGSRYYVSHPLFPLEKTVAMLNLDMISRNGTDSLELVGAPVSPDIAAVIKKENRKPRMTLVPSDDYLGGSDHYSFYKKNVPFMFFFTGLHKDYHTVRDNPDKVDCNKAARVSRLVFYTALKIANSRNHYRVTGKKEESSMFD